MATYSEIEDLRDWVIDTCAEVLTRMDALDGDEPTKIVASLREQADHANKCFCEMARCLSALLIQKKRAGGVDED